MISELNQLEFDKVKHLTDSCRNIEVRAVMSGLNPGRIYVDDATNLRQPHLDTRTEWISANR